MPSFKRATKACLRPFYRGVVRPLCRPLLTRLRDFLTPPPGPTTLEAVQRDVWAAHVQLQALAEHTAQLVRLAGEFGRRLDHSEGVLHETDRMLLSLLKAPVPAGEAAGGHGWTGGALYVGGDRLLATHPHWPFIFLDAADSVATPRAVAHTHEPGVRLALERLVKPGAVAVEIGAGQGYHTLTLAALAGPGGRVLAFEPEPRAAMLLRQTLLCNGLERLVTLRPEAAYHENRILPLYLHLDGCPARAGLVPPEGGGPSVAVAAVRVADVLAAAGLRPDVVRIDAAGAEASVLEGLWPSLEAAPHVKLLFPFAPALLRQAGCLSPDHLLARLEELGFRFWSAGEAGVLDPVETGELLARGGEIVAARVLED